MSLLVKICGLSTPEALDAALDAGADMLGFVFFAPSPRNLGLGGARELGERVGGGARKVPLTVDASDDELARIIEVLAPDMLQLHGRETADRVVTVRTRFGLPVMKALPIARRADLSPIYGYAEVADRLLFDARAPRAASRPGGLGRPFDWRLLENLDPSLSFMLSGGLDAGNVSSGVERALGEKDPARILAFIQAARAAAAALGPMGPRNPPPKYFAPEDLGSQNNTPKDLGQKKNAGTV